MTRLGQIRMDDDAWIGACSIILTDVTIGRCHVVGAGALVTGNVPAYTVAAVVPARPIQMITDEDESRGPSHA